jgi:hypothetical protein
VQDDEGRVSDGLPEVRSHLTEDVGIYKNRIVGWRLSFRLKFRQWFFSRIRMSRREPGDHVQLRPWNPYFFRPLASATSGLIAYRRAYSGMVLWNIESKKAMEVVSGRILIHDLMTARARSLWLERYARLVGMGS